MCVCVGALLGLEEAYTANENAGPLEVCVVVMKGTIGTSIVVQLETQIPNLAESTGKKSVLACPKTVVFV